jgi:hypothetical protein
MIHSLVRASTLAIVCIAATVSESPARTPYDGSWSVLIVTEKGDCDRAYRYGISIVDGNVQYDGGVVNLSGRVAANGTVRVSLTAGSARASGTGRLTRNAGTGKWNGVSSTSACSGYWEAARR